MVVTVFGLSGVGKSWMISRYAAIANVAHIQASQLMRDARAALVARNVTSEDLRRGPVLDNQSLLADAFAKVPATEERPIIFDGHCRCRRTACRDSGRRYTPASAIWHCACSRAHGGNRKAP
jgi:adenylate kinase